MTVWKDLASVFRKKAQIEHAVRLETPAVAQATTLLFRTWPLIGIELLSGFVLWMLSVLPWAVAGALLFNSVLRAPVHPISGAPMVGVRLQALLAEPLVGIAWLGLFVASLFLGVVISTYLHTATLLELVEGSRDLTKPFRVSFQRAFQRARSHFSRFLSLSLWFYLCVALVGGGFLFAHLGEALLLDKSFATMQPVQQSLVLLMQSYSVVLPAMFFLILLYVAYLLCGLIMAVEENANLSEALSLTVIHVKENWRPITRMLMFFFYLYLGMGFLGFLARLGFTHYANYEFLQSAVAVAGLAWTISAWVFAELIWLAGALVQCRLYLNFRQAQEEQAWGGEEEAFIAYDDSTQPTHDLDTPERDTDPMTDPLLRRVSCHA